MLKKHHSDSWQWLNLLRRQPMLASVRIIRIRNDQQRWTSHHGSQAFLLFGRHLMGILSIKLRVHTLLWLIQTHTAVPGVSTDLPKKALFHAAPTMTANQATGYWWTTSKRGSAGISASAPSVPSKKPSNLSRMRKITAVIDGLNCQECKSLSLKIVRIGSMAISTSWRLLTPFSPSGTSAEHAEQHQNISKHIKTGQMSSCWMLAILLGTPNWNADSSQWIHYPKLVAGQDHLSHGSVSGIRQEWKIPLRRFPRNPNKTKLPCIFTNMS